MPTTIEKRQARERALVRGLIRHMKAAGFLCAFVNDGEELVTTTTERAALDAVFSVDESTLCFVLADDAAPVERRRRFGLLAVLGNGDGSEVFCDWHLVEPFNACVDQFCRAEKLY